MKDFINLEEYCTMLALHLPTRASGKAILHSNSGTEIKKNQPSEKLIYA